jgi:hypothetical protein
MANKPAAQPAAARTPSTPVVAKASTEYRVKRFIIVAMLVGLGGWFAYDGLVRWPAENERIEQLKKDAEVARKNNKDAEVGKLTAEVAKLQHHTDSDLRLQKILGGVLPPLGILVLVWSLYHSRGAYRLRDNILTVPGHPPIALDSIRSIDKTDWDRKGIAHIEYELPNGSRGSATLDDFIYQRPPTDEIFKKIEEFTGTGEASSSQPAQA